MAQTNFYEQVSAMWFNGDKQGVLDITNQRLAINSNDIAGLLLKLEYEEEFLLLSNVTNTMTRVLEQVPHFSGSNFAQRIPILIGWGEEMEAVINQYPQNEYIADLARSNMVGQVMSCDEDIKALQADGYFQ